MSIGLSHTGTIPLVTCLNMVCNGSCFGLHCSKIINDLVRLSCTNLSNILWLHSTYPYNLFSISISIRSFTEPSSLWIYIGMCDIHHTGFSIGILLVACECECECECEVGGGGGGGGGWVGVGVGGGGWGVGVGGGGGWGLFAASEKNWQNRSHI